MKLETGAKRRGVYEKIAGSGEWWIRYADANHKLRRELAGTKSTAISLYQKRKGEALVGKKLPENLRRRAVLFSDLAKDALAYSEDRKPLSYRDDKCRMAKLQEHFSDYVAEQVTPQDIDKWLQSHDQWADATKNRYLALVKLTYRLGEVNGKIKVNPARLVRMRRENNAIVRYLNQYTPLATSLQYLNSCKTEESRLRAVIQKNYQSHLVEFDLALNTCLRRSEQYGLVRENVNLEQRVLTIPRSKHGEVRHVRLNTAALTALKIVLSSQKGARVFVGERGALQGSRHWFDKAVKEAGVRDFTWHCLRHTFASRLVMQGVGLPEVMELMGHKSIQVTMRYAHLAPAHQLAAVERLAAYAVQ